MSRLGIGLVLCIVGCASQPHTLTPTEAHALGIALAQTKVALSTYYFEHNALPPDSKSLNPSALGLDPQSAISFTLRPHGTAVLTTASGAKLYAIPTPGNTKLNWECVSPDLSNVTVYLPGCRFDPKF